MRLFGLYFTREARRIHDVFRCTTVTKGLKISRKWNAGRTYAVVMLVVTWLNMARMLSIFHKSDKFGAVLFLKLPMVNCGVTSAVLLTSCFVACHTGNLDRIFRDARLSKFDITRYRRLAVIHAIVCWVLLGAVLPLFLVPTFTMETGFSVAMTPFGVHVSASHQLFIVAEVMTTLMCMVSVFTWLFSHSVNYICYSKVLHVRCTV